MHRWLPLCPEVDNLMKEVGIVYIRWISSQENVIFLSQKTLEIFKIDFQKVILHLGAWKGVLSVKLNEELDENTIGLPKNLVEPYTIPDTLPYNMYLAGEDLHLGPVIAFFVGEGFLSQKRLGKWETYCRNYSQIKGLIYFCTVQGIDMSTKTISGYYYDPNTEETEKLKPGIFPFPGVVYRRARMDLKTLGFLNKQVDGKIFNARIFDKWEMWTVLSEAEFTRTPHTVSLNSIDNLKEMLDLYQAVYLKPATGRFGKGIQRIEKTPDGYLFKEKIGIGKSCKSLAAVFQLVERYKLNRKYIIQQAVPFSFQSKAVDFRVILQKNGSKKWGCSGIIAKVGISGRIYTNNTTYVQLGREALQNIFGLTPEQALEKENEMIGICTEACLHIERAYGHFGDVGLDMVLDENLNVWVLEINKSHQHNLARYQQEDPEMYNRVVSRPLEYAKALAGF